jgi:hypothetical protein
LEERSFAGAEEGKEVVGEIFGERLLGALWPDGVVARVGALSELGQRRVHSGNIAIG